MSRDPTELESVTNSIKAGMRWLITQKLRPATFGMVNFSKWSISGAVVTYQWPTTGKCDPNEIWRPWLEKNVGTQGWSWNWRVNPNDSYQVEVKFRKEQDAILFSLIQSTLK